MGFAVLDLTFALPGVELLMVEKTLPHKQSRSRTLEDSCAAAVAKHFLKLNLFCGGQKRRAALARGETEAVETLPLYAAVSLVVVLRKTFGPVGENLSSLCFFFSLQSISLITLVAYIWEYVHACVYVHVYTHLFLYRGICTLWIESMLLLPLRD